MKRTFLRPALLLSSGLDALALLVLITSPKTSFVYFLVAAIHLLAVVAVWIGEDAPPSRMVVASGLVLMMPLFGALVAVLEQATSGQDEIAQFFVSPEPRMLPPLTAADVNRLTDSLSPLDSLLSGSAEDRRNTLALLGRRADAESVALLRWAVKGPSAELAVEAALALEDLSVRFDTRAAQNRAALEAQPGFETALSAADALAEMIHVGLADPVLLAPLAAEARRYYERAASFAADRWNEVANRWARLERAALCPERAQEILARPAPAGLLEELDSVWPAREKVVHPTKS